ncbi:MAG TPA: hypothetical protein VFZ26_03900 [Gemmatimonadales bacterium]
MTPCDHLSDRMPAVVLRRTRWSADEEAHLAGCADCRAEWDLVQAANRLAAASPGVADQAALTDGLLRRLAEEPVSRVDGRAIRWVGLAAAAALAAAVWLGAGPGPTTVASGAAEPAETLTTAQVDSLLERQDVPLAGWSMLDTPTLGDLNEDELERVLRTWEG